MSNQDNQHTFSDSESSFQSVYPQTPTENISLHDFMDLDEFPMTKHGEVLDPLPISMYMSSESQDIQNPSHDLNLKPFENQMMEAPHDDQNICIVISDDDEKEASDDGRTHSLPHNKYGPYICPNCEDVFPTSQLFAAHVSSAHYRYETASERKRRHDAKYKKKHLQLVQSSHGLTIVPGESSKAQGKRKKAKTAAKTESEIQKPGEGISEAAAAEEFLVDVIVNDGSHQ